MELAEIVPPWDWPRQFQHGTGRDGFSRELAETVPEWDWLRQF